MTVRSECTEQLVQDHTAEFRVLFSAFLRCLEESQKATTLPLFHVPLVFLRPDQEKRNKVSGD